MLSHPCHRDQYLSMSQHIEITFVEENWQNIVITELFYYIRNENEKYWVNLVFGSVLDIYSFSLEEA